MSAPRKLPRGRDERGFSLIELVIYSMLAVLVLTIVGGMLINSLNAQALVRNSAQSSNTGQLVAQSVSHGVRNARALNLAAPTADTLVLRALIVDNAVASPPTAHCEAWYFGGGEVRTTRSDTAIAVPALPSDVSSWTLLAIGAGPVGSDPMVAVSGLTADLRVRLKEGTGAEILIETTAVSRQPATPPTEVEHLCF